MTIGYLAFVVPLIPFGIALEANGPGGPDGGAALCPSVQHSSWLIGRTKELRA